MEKRKLSGRVKSVRDNLGMNLYSGLPIEKKVMPILDNYFVYSIINVIASGVVGLLFNYNLTIVFLRTELILSVLFLFTIHRQQVSLGIDCLGGELGELYKNGYNLILFSNNKYFISTKAKNNEMLDTSMVKLNQPLDLKQDEIYLIGEIISYLLITKEMK